MILIQQRSLLALTLLGTLTVGAQDDGATPDVEQPVKVPTPVVIDMKPAEVDGVSPFVVDRGKFNAALLVPLDEHLEFGIHVSLGPAGATVGTVNLDTGVEHFQKSLVLFAPSDEGEGSKTGWLRAKAKGSYLWYDLKTILDARYLPKKWPSISYFYRQSGSENRRRESLFGEREGRQQTSYRRDSSNGAPAGERIWQPAEFRDIPEGCIDMLGAVYLSRSLLLSGRDELSFPLLDKKTLWRLTLRKGESKVVDVPAGRFNAIEIILDPATYPGEPKKESEKFEGLFGIKGSIHLWVDELTGVPVRIAGTIPAGPVDIDCDIYLEKYSGTPTLFKPLEEPAEDE